MVYASKSGRVNDMTTPGPGNSFLSDSLEASSNNWQRMQSSVVEPVDYAREEVNRSAFSAEDKILGPFPKYVINLLRDANDWKNRTSGVTKMQSIINGLPSDYSLEPHLDGILELATSTLNDNHFKVTQLGLELIACIVAKFGNSIRPFFPSLVQGIMSKVGSSKFVLKQAGLQVLKELMVALRPQPVVNEVIKFGLHHKLSKVREESLNVITVSLLTFPKSEFNLSSILKEAIPTMGDSKSRVRQASFEIVALICSIEPSAVKGTVTEIVSQRDSHKCKYSTQNGLTLMVAFQTRLARGTSGVPKLNENGNVEYSISISNNKAVAVSGDDVQWILAGGGGKSPSSGDVSEVKDGTLSQPIQRKGSLSNGVASSSRPYRSAGKRLPWEMEGEELVRNHLTMPVKELAPLPNPQSPKHLPFSPPPVSPSKLPIQRKKNYSDMYMVKVSSTQKPLAAVQPPPNTGGHWGNGGSSLSSANDRGPPLFTSRHASVGDEHTSIMQPNASMSVTWPRPGGGGALMRGTNQITADTSKITGVHNYVKTSVSRPLSKPRVRNPLNSMKPPSNQSTAHRDSPTQLEKEFLSSGNGGSETGSMPTGWADTSWEEEYFTTIPEDITILNSSLSSSLSSLCAGRGDLEGAKEASSEVDKLKHIRKEAASRKAQLLSAATSASNSPECSRQSSGETRGHPSNQELARGRPSNQGEISTSSAPTKKPKRPKPHTQNSFPSSLNATFTTPSRWLPVNNTDPTINLSRTYNPGGGPDKTYAAAYAAKKLTTPPKSFKSSHSQKDRERLLAEGSKVMSIEEPSMVSDTSRASFGKRKSRKDSEVRTSGRGTDMIDMEVSGNTSHRHAKPVELHVVIKSQSAGYSSAKKPPIAPTTSEPSSATPERKRSKHKKPSPPLKRQVDLYDERQKLETSQNGSPDNSFQELQPFSSPEAGLRDSLQGMEAEDWSAKVEGLVGIRRLAMYHSDVLLPRLHTIVLAVEREVKNLRSSVARAALVCFGDLFATVGPAMEKDLDGIVKVLLHKGTESNAFIREDVEKALYEMVVNVSHHKCLIALINGGLAHRNIQVRKTTGKHICLILEAQGPSKFLHSSKDLIDRTLPAIVQLAIDNAVEVRYFGKRCLHQLWPLADFERISSRVLTASLLTRSKEVVENLRAKGLGDPPAENQSAKTRHSTLSTVRGSSIKPLQHHHQADPEPTPTKDISSKKARKYLSSNSNPPPEPVTMDVPLPDGLLEKMKSSNWSERFEAVAELESFVNNYPKALGPHLLKVFDLFCPRLTDRNSKVNLRALEAFSIIVPLLCDTLTPVATNIVTALVPNLASRNATIYSSAMTALDLLIQCIDPAHLIQPVAKSGQFGNARVRPIMISKLADLTMYIYAQKPQLVTRQVVPILWHLVSAKTPLTGDTRTAAMTLCAALISTMGLQTLTDNASHLTPEAQRKWDDLILSLRTDDA